MQYDVIIIGGGIVGMATAYQLNQLQPGIRILVLEKEHELGKHQTGNNSGVIHSGLYYKPGSLKAENCIRGYHMLIDFCKTHGVAYEITGKVVVATREDELTPLENLYQRGIANGLEGIRKIGPEEIKAIEPHCTGIAGLWVPQTGIVDYPGMLQKMAELIRQNGQDIKTGAQVQDVQINGQEVIVKTTLGDFNGKQLVNCAGLFSDRIAALSIPDINVRIIPFRGEYYELKPEKHHLVKNLIYPVPDPNFPFLGVHFTRMIKGGVEAGPNAVFAFKREGYKKTDFNWKDFSESIGWPGFRKVAAKYWKTGLGEYYRSFSKAAFTKALQRLIPEIQEDDLIPGGAGVRAQACDRQGGLIDDFLIYENERVVNVCNAPSPAATSSLSIGLTIAEKVKSRFATPQTASI